MSLDQQQNRQQIRGGRAPQHHIRSSSISIASSCKNKMAGAEHSFGRKTFHKPTYCHHCSDLLWGLIGQGYICEGPYLQNTVNPRTGTSVPRNVWSAPWPSISSKLPMYMYLFASPSHVIGRPRELRHQSRIRKIPPEPDFSCESFSRNVRIIFCEFASTRLGFGVPEFAEFSSQVIIVVIGVCSPSRSRGPLAIIPEEVYSVCRATIVACQKCEMPSSKKAKEK